MAGPYTAKHLLAAAVATVTLIGGVMAYRAIRYQASGTAVYWEGYEAIARQEVKRDVSPSEFRSVVRATWEVSACCFIIAGLGLVVYRKLAADE